MVGLGVAAGFLRRKNERGGEGGHYFLAGNTLAWKTGFITGGALTIDAGWSAGK